MTVSNVSTEFRLFVMIPMFRLSIENLGRITTGMRSGSRGNGAVIGADWEEGEDGLVRVPDSEMCPRKGYNEILAGAPGCRLNTKFLRSFNEKLSDYSSRLEESYSDSSCSKGLRISIATGSVTPSSISILPTFNQLL